MTPMGPTGVAVVGSANLDQVMAVQRLPAPGETVLGQELSEVAGGKGLNQAIAAARHSPSTLIGCVGNDPAARTLEEALKVAGVDTRHLQRSTGPTGHAFISVAADGENSIVVLPLANRALDASRVLHALDAIRPAVVLSQLEIPIDVVAQAATWSAANGARFVLNASPVTVLPRALLELSDPLIVNASEARAILPSIGSTTSMNLADAESAARALVAVTSSVVVTDGSNGAWAGSTPDEVTLVPGHPVVARDTTGAGDEFAGVLAAHLARGVALTESASVANSAAARLVQIPRAKR